MASEAPQSAWVNVSRRDIEEPAIIHRSADYKPTSWDYTYIQKLNSNYTEEAYGPIVDKLKGEVRSWFNGFMEPWLQLQLIYNVQRLGLGYHFEEEIRRALSYLFTSGYHIDVVQKNGLHATAVCFMLLRQHGFMVSEEIFKHFMDENGSFMPCHFDDVEGLLSLYQASFLAFDGEIILEAARIFAMQSLREMDTPSDGEVATVIDFPSHLTITRLDARHFIDTYERGEDVNPTLLQLAKIDFNMVQNIYQKEMKTVISWWRKMGLAKKMSSIRDRIMECFFGTVGIVFNPQFGYCREELTKVGMLIAIIDDVYDIYGSMDELKLFTDAIGRWDNKVVEDLPEYMKACFYALYNTTNQMACDIQRTSGQDVLSYLKNTWTDLCDSFLVEAKWHHNKYMPTFKEYLNNSWVSISGPLILIHVYLLLQHPPKETMQSECANLIRLSSMIFRLYNDLATSMVEQERGDVPSSIECYMHESGVSETIAREHISSLISKAWKEMNREYQSCPFIL